MWLKMFGFKSGVMTRMSIKHHSSESVNKWADVWKVPRRGVTFRETPLKDCKIVVCLPENSTDFSTAPELDKKIGGLM